MLFSFRKILEHKQGGWCQLVSWNRTGMAREGHMQDLPKTFATTQVSFFSRIQGKEGGRRFCLIPALLVRKNSSWETLSVFQVRERAYRMSFRAPWNSTNSLLFLSSELNVWPMPPWKISSRVVLVKLSKISKVCPDFEPTSAVSLSRSWEILIREDNFETWKLIDSIPQ